MWSGAVNSSSFVYSSDDRLCVLMRFSRHIGDYLLAIYFIIRSNTATLTALSTRACVGNYSALSVLLAWRTAGSLAFFTGLAIVPLPASAATMLVVPRAPVVRVAPRTGASVRSHYYRASKPSLFWWPWWSAAPCKKGKDGRCHR